jgi:putative acetyltransferase
MSVMIRPEEPKDFTGVYTVNAAAFDTPAEANLVEVLRVEAHPYVSLVAEEDGEIVGHILFSPVVLSGHEDLKIMGLGPIAVAPGQQMKGIGSALVKVGLERCKDLSYSAVVVLGHKGYYPRFGFTPSVKFGIGCEYDVPPEVFMVIELVPGYLQEAQGIIRYHNAFNEI